MTEWNSFLDTWSTTAISVLKREGPLTEAAVIALREKTIRRSGASLKALQAAEKRLRTTLPTTYRSFLLASNGVSFIGDILEARLLGVEAVGWFRELQPRACSDWSTDFGFDPVPSEIYLERGPNQDASLFRREDVSHLLLISDYDEEHGTCLLNPKLRTGDGEWEAWILGAKIPGAIRYSSFGELVLENAKLVRRKGETSRRSNTSTKRRS